jgi:hypothetical protein
MGESHTGQCHCGGVRYSVEGERTGVIACHCRDCQQMHGNYNPMAAVPETAVTFEADDTLVWYVSSEKAQRGFCSRCGSRLFKKNNGSDRLLISMGTFDPPTGMRFMKHIWTESKGDWYDVPDVEPPATGT